jgi:hypothetical protein
MSIDKQRKWVPIGWHCTSCSYTYTVASDTLIYNIGGKDYQSSYKGVCPKCDLKLVRLYRHINPKTGKQQWISMGWYCKRCKYTWIDEQMLQVTH